MAGWRETRLLVGYTAVLALYLLLATGFLGVFPHPHGALLWEVADWAAVAVCLAADAYFLYCIASHRRSSKNISAPLLLPPPPPQMDLC
uniref:Uncharacterized protein n=1 Tax=Oryza punctata TaxID=4537 RepID=A0A0E0LIM0_ORYPU